MHIYISVKDRSMKFYKIEDVDYDMNKDDVVRIIHTIMDPKDRKQHKGTTGYYSITLYNNGLGYRRSIHRLLAQISIPNPETNHV